MEDEEVGMTPINYWLTILLAIALPIFVWIYFLEYFENGIEKNGMSVLGGEQIDSNRI